MFEEIFIEKRSFTFWVTEMLIMKMNTLLDLFQPVYYVYKYVLHGVVGSSAAYTLSGSQPTLFLFEFLSRLVGSSFPEKSNLVNYNLTTIIKKKERQQTNKRNSDNLPRCTCLCNRRG